MSVLADKTVTAVRLALARHRTKVQQLQVNAVFAFYKFQLFYLIKLIKRLYLEFCKRIATEDALL